MKQNRRHRAIVDVLGDPLTVVLRAYRWKAQYTIREASTAVGISPWTLNDIELGRRAIGPAIAAKLLRHYSVPERTINLILTQRGI